MLLHNNNLRPPHRTVHQFLADRQALLRLPKAVPFAPRQPPWNLWNALWMTCVCLDRMRQPPPLPITAEEAVVEVTGTTQKRAT